MKRIVTNQQMKLFDQHTIEQMQVPALVLMERAALAVVEELKQQAFNLERILVVCGNGNNGGDGVAIARLLHLGGYTVSIYPVGDVKKGSDGYQQQLRMAQNYGVPVVKEPHFNKCTTIVDAIFGVGLSRAVADSYERLFTKMNNSAADILAVDIPSGIDGNSGKVMKAAVRAAVTVTFAFIKPGLLLYPGADYANKVICKDVGIYETKEQSPFIYMMEPVDRMLLPSRPAYSNKGSFGKVLLVAGSKDMCGAAYLSAKACLRSGAGMVKIYTERSNREVLLRQLPEAMVTTYESSWSDVELARDMAWADVIGIGPGMGTSELARQIFTYTVAHTNKPLVIDADGLNLLSKQMDLLTEHQGQVIVTPHLGEMARLTGQDVTTIQGQLLACASDFTKQYHTTCVLKDARTITADVAGQMFINTSGNSGMATAGSGDVLTGILLGLLAQDQNNKMLIPLGVYLHGVAGDRAQKHYSNRGMMASDLLEQIPMAMGNIQE